MSETAATGGTSDHATGGQGETATARGGRGAAVMAAGTFVSRILGMVRNVMLVAAIGATGPIADAFDIANKIPNILFALLATGVINAVLVPQIVRAMKTDHAQEYLNKLLTFAGGTMLVITLACTLFAPQLVWIYIAQAGWSPAQNALAIAFAYWCMPQVFFYGLYAILGQVLNARSQFGPFMWAPVLNNIVSIAGLGAFIAFFGGAARSADGLAQWTSSMTVWIGALATVGVASQALILLIPLARSGFTWRPQFGFRGYGLRSAGTVSLWVLLATVVDQVGVWWMTRAAAAAPEAAAAAGFTGTVAGNGAYTQVLTVYILPHSLVTVSVATVLFTGMSKAAIDGNMAGVRDLLSSGIRVIGVFTMLAFAAFVVLPVPILRALVPTMRPDEIMATAPALIAFGAGLVPLGIMVLVKWAYFAFEDGKSVFLMQIPGTLIIGVGVWLVRELLPGEAWLIGIGVTMAAANLIVSITRLVGLRSTLHGVDGARIIRLYVRVTLAAAVAAVPGWFIAKAAHAAPTMGWAHAIGVCAVAGLVMALVYLALLRAMRVTEVDELLRPIRRRITRKLRGPGAHA